jgi:ComF family protein
LKRLFKGLADLVFPPRCITCGSLLTGEGIHPFCLSCTSRIHFIQSPLCTCCGMPFSAGEGRDHLCGDCVTAEQHFKTARAVGKYEAVLLEAIHRFKYQGRVHVGEELGRYMAGCDYASFRIDDHTMLVPVPLHRKRLRERGFNQSVILAREVARRHSMPMNFNVLRRSVWTEPQVGLGKDARGANVRGAFEVKDREKIKGEKILLVDDVYTTGSTVRECARVLKAGGAAEVGVLTLARAV